MLVPSVRMGRSGCSNEVLGRLGLTGRHVEKTASVLGTGVAIPSLATCVHELSTDYRVQTLIRVRTCGAVQPHLKVKIGDAG